MTLSLVLAIVAAPLVVMAGLTPHVRRDIRSSTRHAEFWATPALVLGPPLVIVVDAFFPNVVGDELLPIISAGPIVLIAALRLVLLVRRRAQWSVAGAVMAAMALVVTVVAAASGQGWQHGAIATVALAGVALHRPGSMSAAVNGIVAAVIAAVALTAVYALVVPGAMRTDCGANTSKCDLMGGFISIGAGGGSNALGITLAMLVGVVVFRVGGLRGFLVGAGVVAMILATGARLATGGAALIVVIAAAAFSLAWVRRALPLVTVGLTAMSVVPAFFPFPADAFTERATLWQRARDFVVESPLVGHGLSFWVRDAETQPPPPRSYSPHNLWLDLLVAGGAVSTLVIVAAVVIGIRMSANQARPLQLLLSCGVVTAGVFEATVMPFRFGPIPAGFLVLVLLLAVGESNLRRRRLLTRLGAGRRRPHETGPASSPA